jgi:hypothetical protein
MVRVKGHIERAGRGVLNSPTLTAMTNRETWDDSLGTP